MDGSEDDRDGEDTSPRLPPLATATVAAIVAAAAEAASSSWSTPRVPTSPHNPLAPPFEGRADELPSGTPDWLRYSASLASSTDGMDLSPFWSAEARYARKGKVVVSDELPGPEPEDLLPPPPPGPGGFMADARRAGPPPVGRSTMDPHQRGRSGMVPHQRARSSTPVASLANEPRTSLRTVGQRSRAATGRGLLAPIIRSNAVRSRPTWWACASTASLQTMWPQCTSFPRDVSSAVERDTDPSNAVVVVPEVAPRLPRRLHIAVGIRIPQPLWMQQGQLHLNLLGTSAPHRRFVLLHRLFLMLMVMSPCLHHPPLRVLPEICLVAQRERSVSKTFQSCRKSSSVKMRWHPEHWFS